MWKTLWLLAKEQTGYLEVVQPTKSKLKSFLMPFRPGLNRTPQSTLSMRKRADKQNGNPYTIKTSVIQGRSQKWPKEGVLRPEIAKGGILRMRKLCGYALEHRFVMSFGKNSQKIWANGGEGASDPHIPPLATPLVSTHLALIWTFFFFFAKSRNFF